LTSHLDLQSHTHAKGQGKRSLGSKVIVETDGQTDEQMDGGDYTTSCANAVGNKDNKHL